MLSVILCTYNRSALVRRALRSLQRQRSNNFELVVVDDGSQDDSVAILEKILPQLPFPTKLLALPVNGGHARARNHGLRACSRPWATFLDSDDIYGRDHLHLRLEAIEKNPGVDLWHSPVTVYGDPYVVDKNDPRRKIHLNECRIGGTFVFRRSKALAMGGFPEIDYADDAAFFACAEKNRWTIGYLPFPTYHYDRRQPDSLTHHGGKPTGEG